MIGDPVRLAAKDRSLRTFPQPLRRIALLIDAKRCLAARRPTAFDKARVIILVFLIRIRRFLSSRATLRP